MQEADGLAVWRGRGTVVLHAAAFLDDAIALLLERCVPGTALSSRPETDQDRVIADLLARVWIQPDFPHRFRPLEQMCELWAGEFEDKVAHRGLAIDPGLARGGIAREPWLVIDPKPYIGDPTYDALQHMLNCDQRLHADPLAFIRQMAELLHLDADRLRLWLFARCVQESAEWPTLADIATRIAPA